jgi:DNA-directed RNA polymerase subunit M/transcription elongation factor TFIIS
MSKVTYREKGCKSLNLVMNVKYSKTIEELIHNKCDSQDHYKLIIQEIINHKRSGKSYNNIIKLVEDRLFLENTEEYKIFKIKLDEIDDFLVNPFEVDEGVLDCHKCGSNKTFSYTKQTRGGDESTTVFVVCSKCKSRWKI